ncbi:hypothetical protein KBA27_01555 [bacterium]|nr:hypothetical protein [bacterium]
MKKAQSLVEYTLIFLFIAVVCGTIVSHFNFGAIRNILFGMPTGKGNTVEMPAMTEETIVTSTSAVVEDTSTASSEE